MGARHRRFGALCVLGYVALSWTARFDMRLHEQDMSLLYPLDTFSMYARPPGEDRSLLLVRTADGVVHPVTDFRAFACAEPILGSGARCAETRGIRYHFEELARYIETHSGTGTLDVDAQRGRRLAAERERVDVARAREEHHQTDREICTE